MNILVTGGLGFIGSHLVDKLSKNNNNIFVIDNLSTGSKKNINKNAKYTYEDLKVYIKNPSRLKRFLKQHKIHIVFHLAANANVNSSINNPMQMIDDNFNASIALLEACKVTNVKKFIFASTSAVYGEPKYLPVDELHPTSPISPYGLSKLMFEYYTEYFSKNGNVSIMNFRLPNVYGPRQRADLEGGVIAIFSEKMKKQNLVEIFGDGKQKRDWVHVQDIIRAFEITLKINFKFEIIALGSKISNSVNDLFRILKELNSFKMNAKKSAKRDGDIKYMVMDNKKASKKLGWKPKISLIEGLKLLN